MALGFAREAFRQVKFLTELNSYYHAGPISYRLFYLELDDPYYCGMKVRRLGHNPTVLDVLMTREMSGEKVSNEKAQRIQEEIVKTLLRFYICGTHVHPLRFTLFSRLFSEYVHQHT